MHYDLIIIGAGPAGYEAALFAARLGRRVALVEKRELGGTCLNRGCIPTKALLHAAELFRAAGDAGSFGVACEGVGYDMDAIFARKDAVVERLRGGVASLLAAAKVDVLRGAATIPEKGKVRVGDTVYETEHILIATGAAAARPPVEGIELPGVVTSDELLAQAADFDSIAIIGGGVIGMEFASFYSALGKRVSVIEFMPRILPGFDREVSQNLSMILKRRGVDIRVGTALQRIRADAGSLVCECDKTSVAADRVLIATGRRPYFEGLFSDALGIQTNRGIVVNADFRTSVESIYAVGDVVDGGVQLAHLATAQALYAVARMAGAEPETNLGVIPSCVYTSPEIAAVGLTEAEAKERGIAVRTGKYPMSANARTLIDDAERGFIKLVFDAASGQTLGATLMCERASDLIGEPALAVAKGLGAADISGVIHAHPTYYEGLAEATRR
ncbi:MAG: dihydrolipoyl dehydrogenase [Clostridiales bacterium]|nr:dihydrolipoyl dehydrogenase [Clostridiales bacterium]